MIIRDATADDAPAVAALLVQLGYPADEQEARERLVTLLNRAEEAVIVAAEAERAVGWIHAGVSYSLEQGAYAEIRGLVVDEEHRSRGVGGQLVDAVEQWARERQLPRVRLRSNVKRERARRFYERRGYRVTKTQNAFQKEL